MTPSDQDLSIRRLRFPTDLEASYRIWQYVNARRVLRIALFPLIAFALFSAVRDFSFFHVPVYAIGGNGIVIVFCLLLIGLTFSPKFEKVWQPVTVGLVWIAMTLMLNSPIVTGLHTASERKTPTNLSIISPSVSDLITRPDPNTPVIQNSSASRSGPSEQMLLVQLFTLIIFLSAFRLRFFWAMLLNSGLLLSACWVLIARLHAPSQALLMFGERSALVIFALMISALVQERLSRTAFLANYLLDQERNEEKKQRERTEGMLHVLSQAIGGIVHDLGNPLTAVQGGAQVLEQMLEKGAEPAKLKKMTAVIVEGAEMLNYQRLSLMEQTRILEGKPIPIECQITTLRQVIETAMRYQNPRFADGRHVAIDGDDLQMHVDKMKLTSVFVNLIGNAMKYSDGEIHICWHIHDDRAWIAILDQGLFEKSISESQANDLFVAFSRLETHSQIEGTGLGLLSVRKILEAHGGEVYVEGHLDGNQASPFFSTATAVYPSMLREGFLTAFVLVCPLFSSEDG